MSAAAATRPVTVIEPGRHSGHTGSPRRVLTLAWTLALTDWKLRFYGSVLGYVWSLLRPLMLFGILYFVFSEIVRVGASSDSAGKFWSISNELLGPVTVSSASSSPGANGVPWVITRSK